MTQAKKSVITLKEFEILTSVLHIAEEDNRALLDTSDGDSIVINECNKQFKRIERAKEIIFKVAGCKR